jgi:hypothetical protein
MFKIIFARYRHHVPEDEAMPYLPKQKRDTREKILESARRLFNRKGYFAARMSCTRRPFGSSFARRRPQLGKSGESRGRSRSPAPNGSSTPTFRAGTSRIA